MELAIHIPLDSFEKLRDYALSVQRLRFSKLNAKEISREIEKCVNAPHPETHRVYNQALETLKQITKNSKVANDLFYRLLALCILDEGYDVFTFEIMMSNIRKQHKAKENIPFYAMLANDTKRIYEELSIEWMPCTPDRDNYVELAKAQRAKFAQDRQELIDNIIHAESKGYNGDAVLSFARELHIRFGVDLKKEASAIAKRCKQLFPQNPTTKESISQVEQPD